MKEKLEKLNAASGQHLRLSGEERAAMLRALRAATGANFAELPAAADATESVFWRLRVWPTWPDMRQPVTVQTAVPIALIFLCVLGGGTAYAAERALPGDLLYPVKIHLNESAREALALSALAEAELQASLAERRAEEAEELAVRGELSPAARADLEARLDNRVDKLARRLEDLDDDVTRAQIVVNLEAVVRGQADVVAIVAALEGGEAVPMSAQLAATVRKLGHLRVDAEGRLAASDDAALETAAADRKEAAEGKIEAADRLAGKERHAISVAASTAADATIAIARALVVEGDAKVATGQHGDAFYLYQEAYGKARSTEVSLEGAADLAVHRRRAARHDGGAATGSAAVRDSDSDAPGEAEANMNLDGSVDAGGALIPEIRVRADGRIKI